MKKKNVMMLGVAAILSSAFFTGSAFAKVDRDEDPAIYVPTQFFQMPNLNHAQLQQQVNTGTSAVESVETANDSREIK